MRSGALLLRSDNAAHSASEDARERAFPSEASGQRGHSNKVRAPDTRPEPGSSAHAALDAYAAVAVANAPKPVVLRSVAVPAAHLSC
jgi:hypothetical protein